MTTLSIIILAIMIPGTIAAYVDGWVENRRRDARIHGNSAEK